VGTIHLDPYLGQFHTANRIIHYLSFYALSFESNSARGVRRLAACRFIYLFVSNVHIKTGDLAQMIN
jgi:hypothetical protein